MATPWGSQKQRKRKIQTKKKPKKINKKQPLIKKTGKQPYKPSAYERAQEKRIVSLEKQITKLSAKRNKSKTPRKLSKYQKFVSKGLKQGKDFKTISQEWNGKKE